ncbi:uncharacterized protein L969DRAFT_280703 [Mixia osmundae IAM 14324]|uniref:JmjC domain-containing protein n=1 Tax=Mixia osmundae (strain CBS 9802 / IAM 14324 / JCM 22182 / KY 12970) TaxID=764103 RepID=G7E4C6_MIXOS|nr:uncharacterized protein L969DRAFT_280703 [Mixia osmundae IAM 14324]KEI36297.1 hypothetical protein L969DRAFT_280703 [Mixia osmundae IAM 14324]GAA97686.1 hypothetical protein E5Q_04364 [Mixia osmundae IAM 14324]
MTQLRRIKTVKLRRLVSTVACRRYDDVGWQRQGALVSYLAQSDAQPIHFTREGAKSSRELFDLLRKSNTLAEVEIGRYDQPESFDKVEIPLGTYMELLDAGKGQFGDKAVYLAQWPGLEAMPALKEKVTTPPWLQEALDVQQADLYRASFFVGPTSAITPLHHDPYDNLFELKEACRALKHFTILPKRLSHLLRSSEQQKNTSSVDFDISSGKLALSAASPSQKYAQEILNAAQTCVLAPGDTLLLPRGFWHRVETISTDSAQPGWAASIGFWFRMRAN